MNGKEELEQLQTLLKGLQRNKKIQVNIPFGPFGFKPGNLHSDKILVPNHGHEEKSLEEVIELVSKRIKGLQFP
jgi:hypothetical protein